MKFKKFLIIFLCVALLAAFSVSCFATSQESYGFYISPGDYVFDEALSVSSNPFNLIFDFISDSSPFYGLHLYLVGDVTFYYLPNTSSETYVYQNGAWISQDYRYITVTDGFYIYDINTFQWWQSNVTRVDSGYDNNLLDGILSSFTFIGEWIAGAANAVTPMFWDGEALTVVGTLSVAGLSFAVVFLLIALVSSFMKFRS